MGTRDVLAVFTRYPETGKTKTRMIPRLGARQAAALQRRMTEHTLRIADAFACPRGASVVVRFAGGDRRRMGEWLGAGRPCEEQGGGHLGDRMARTLRDHLDAGASAVVLVGADCPGLTVALLAAAFEALADHDVVYGPAADGGYYLVGAARPLPELFRDIAWGGPEVLAASLRAARTAGLTVALLPTLRDVDRPEDLPVWEALGEGR